MILPWNTTTLDISSIREDILSCGRLVHLSVVQAPTVPGLHKRSHPSLDGSQTSLVRSKDASVYIIGTTWDHLGRNIFFHVDPCACSRCLLRCVRRRSYSTQYSLLRSNVHILPHTTPSCRISVIGAFLLPHSVRHALFQCYESFHRDGLEMT